MNNILGNHIITNIYYTIWIELRDKLSEETYTEFPLDLIQIENQIEEESYNEIIIEIRNKINIS